MFVSMGEQEKGTTSTEGRLWSREPGWRGREVRRMMSWTNEGRDRRNGEGITQEGHVYVNL